METDDSRPLDPELESRVIQLTRQNKQVEAVRTVRKATRLGLAEAKRLVDEIHAAQPPARGVLESPGGQADAAAALAAVEQARSAGLTPIPAWFFPAVGLLVAGAMALQAISPPELGLVGIALLAAGYVLVERVYAGRVLRSGAAPRELTLRQQLLLVAPLVPLWVAGEILDVHGGWVWLVVAGVSAGWTVAYGIVHNRRVRASA